MTFTGLPTDVLFHIFRTLAPLDILAVRQTCASLNAVTYERTVWFNALNSNFFEKNLPVPGLRGCALSQLSSPELEYLTFRALKLCRNWTSTSPRRTRTLEITPFSIRDGSRNRCIAIHFIPGDGRTLLSVTMHDFYSLPRSYTVQCWDIEQETPPCTAIYRCNYFVTVCVNSVPSHPVAIAITRRLIAGVPGDSPTVTATMSFHPSINNPTLGMTTLAEFPGTGHSLGLFGTKFVGWDNMHNIQVLDAETGDLLYVLHAPNPLNDLTWSADEYRPMGVIVMKQFILAFCQRWIHLYILPSPEGNNQALGNGTIRQALDLDPAAGFKWQWRIDSLVVSHQGHGDPDTRQDTLLDPINIFIRFDTWYPWPVNILHHFVLPPNPSFDPSVFSKISHHHSLPSLENIPYLFTAASTLFGPYMTTSVASPMRLFTPSDMVLGKYGTALWIDAQTDFSSPSQAGDHGQRIAGKMLSATNLRNHHLNLSDPMTHRRGDDQVSPGYIDFQPGAHLAEGESVHSIRSEDENSIMVFEVRDNYDGWNRLALDEEEGRIAVGSVDGTINIFDYAPLHHKPGQSTPSTSQ